MRRMQGALGPFVKVSEGVARVCMRAVLMFLRRIEGLGAASC